MNPKKRNQFNYNKCKKITVFVTLNLPLCSKTPFLVHVISFKKLREYFAKETNAKIALQDWYKKTNKAEWESFADLRNTFNSADSVGNARFVFNIKGNHYRIVAIVRFKFKKVLIRWVGNHGDYNKLKNIDKL